MHSRFPVYKNEQKPNVLFKCLWGQYLWANSLCANLYCSKKQKEK